LHLCAELAARGHRLRVLDDLSTGSEADLVPGAELLRGDAADPRMLRDAMAGMDGCFHLAAVASVERGVRAAMLGFSTCPRRAGGGKAPAAAGTPTTRRACR
jgi:nucleoside-diphosphate-sugar epimerase